ncbi:MAG: hypothetical protein LQ342_000587 [Letrouitia transgressa]|nr:MAG: hypothetical protein LQ342_000587 [Letrouitia transgressa]
MTAPCAQNPYDFSASLNQNAPGAHPFSFPDAGERARKVSTQLSLFQEVEGRKAEYVHPCQTKIKIGTWNVAGIAGSEKDIGDWFVGGEKVASEEGIGLYVLGLQEIVDITSISENTGAFNDQQVVGRWIKAVERALPRGYAKVVEQRLVGLLLLVYASPSLQPIISYTSSTSVKTGAFGLANKGAVATRIELGEVTRLTFINSHLAAGTEPQSLWKRNSDFHCVQNATKFEPKPNPYNDVFGIENDFEEGIGDEDFVFWFGDLNYRLDGVPGDDVRRLLMAHIHHSTENDTLERTVYTDQDSSFDSLQSTIASLLPHDQLKQQMREHKAFNNGWREGDITFLPTYKYDPGTVDILDTSEKKRSPSWCDRILFRTRENLEYYRQKLQEEKKARKRDEELKARSVDDIDDMLLTGDAGNDSDDGMLYDYDSESDGTIQADEGFASQDPDVNTTEANLYHIGLEYYKSHQQIISSDHKPVNAVFTMTFNAVDQKVKAAVYKEVVQEHDKAENERQPGVTVDVDCLARTLLQEKTVDFEQIHYDWPKTREITVGNTTNVPATIFFVGQLGTRAVAPSWLSIRFNRIPDEPGSRDYTLLPGEAINISLTIHITSIAQVRELNAKTESTRALDEVLILRVDKGMDHYVSVWGTWEHSVFGYPLSKSTPAGEVKNFLQLSLPKFSLGVFAIEDYYVDPVRKCVWSAPKEIFLMTDLIQRAVTRITAEASMKEGDFHPPWARNYAWPFAIAYEDWTPANDIEAADLRLHLGEGLDARIHFPRRFGQMLSIEGRADMVEAMATTLITFLSSLEDGVIPESMFELMQAEGIELRETESEYLEETWQLATLNLLTLKPAHSAAFTAIMNMLKSIAYEISSLNVNQELPWCKRILEATGKIFAEVMIRSPSADARIRKPLGYTKWEIVRPFLLQPVSTK